MSNENFDAAMDLMTRRKRAKSETHYVDLQDNEKAIVQAATRIYAAYIESGVVETGKEDEFQNRSIKEALEIASIVERLVSDADEEVK